MSMTIKESDFALEIYHLGEKTVAKCRMYITSADIKSHFKSNPAFVLEDRFYSNISKTNKNNNTTTLQSGDLNGVFYRERFKKNLQGEWELLCRTVQDLIKHDLSNTSICTQRSLDLIPSSKHDFERLDCFLSFAFERYLPLDGIIPAIDNSRNITDNNPITAALLTAEYKVNLDMVIKNSLRYYVLTLSYAAEKVDILMTTEFSHTARNKLIDLSRNFSSSTYPIYTKFMYMLRLSSNQYLSFDGNFVYGDEKGSDMNRASPCGIQDRIDAVVDELLELKEKRDKEYIWIVSHVHKLFESCIDAGFDEVQAINYILRRRQFLVEDPHVTFQKVTFC